MAPTGRKPDLITMLGDEGRDWFLPLLYYHSEKANSQDHVPAEVKEKLKALQQQIVARNLFLFGELRRILEMFNDAGIEVIVLKGAALTEGLYPHLGLRPFSDIDLLIHREKLHQVIETLRGLGYCPYSPQLRPRAEDFQGGVNYVKDGELTIMIEPHWILGPPYPYAGRVDIEGVWERARKAKIAGVDTLVLCPEDFLLHLCLHLFQHHQDNWLTSACDIAEMANHYEGELDWKAFLNRVFEFKICLPVQYGLEKTSELFHPPIPSFVLEQLDTCKPSRFGRRFFALLTGPRDENGGGAVTLARLLTMPGAALKFRYLWLMLFPSRDFMLSRYAVTKPELLPFYYLFRLKDSFWIALQTFFRFAFPKESG